MPLPIAGFKYSDAPTNSLGWDVPLTQTQPQAVALLNNEGDREVQVWGDGTDYLGVLPAFMVYIPVVLPRIYSMLEFRIINQLYAQAPVSFYVNGSLYNVGETLPVTTPIALPRQIDSIRQWRVVAVPTGLSHFYTNQYGGTGTSVIATFVPTAGQLAQSHAGIYIYYANVSVRTSTTATVGDYTLEMQWRTAGGVAVGSPFVFARFSLANGTTYAVGWELAPTWPLAAIGQIPATATKVDLQFTQQGGAGVGCFFTVAAFMDPANTATGTGEIGFGQLWNPSTYEQAGQPYPYF